MLRVLMAKVKPIVLFVLGGPGSGKGTQCTMLKTKYPDQVAHLSAGELLREAQRAGGDTETPETKIIKECMVQGKIVPVEITVNLLYNEMLKMMNAKTGSKNLKEKERLFLIDGFPRNEDNVNGWNRVVGEKADVVGCLFFNCSEEVMEERVLGRKEGARVDDNRETLRRRFAGHVKDTMPIVERYKDQSKCWEIDATKPVEEVFIEVHNVIAALVPKLNFTTM